VAEAFLRKGKWQIPAEPVGSLQIHPAEGGGTAGTYIFAQPLYLLQCRSFVFSSGLPGKTGQSECVFDVKIKKGAVIL
jgi:hypothetical protein